MALNLQVPPQQDEFRPRICVVGVGGAGGNAINNMISSGLEGVEFLVCNTDAQDLAQSLCENRLQLGPTVTKGLGAGMQPHVGAEAAQESIEEILHRLDGANMVFITAGMGGGTGTGAAAVIAKALRERTILTVGVVTKPFQFEGLKRAKYADEGIANLSSNVDTLIVIPNQNLFRLANEKTTFADAFKMADNVLLDGVRGVSDLIVKPGIVNLDFADVRTLMTVMGKAMMGTGEAEGETRALEAAERAISNPLLDDMSLDGAQGVLINVTGGYDITLYEVDAVANHVREKVDPDANIIFGSSVDESMTGGLRVSVVATGIDADQMRPRTPQGVQPLGPGNGPSGGPSGPGGGMPQMPASAPTAPTPPPVSPFGRSPFAFRSGSKDQGPKSQMPSTGSPSAVSQGNAPEMTMPSAGSAPAQPLPAPAAVRESADPAPSPLSPENPAPRLHLTPSTPTLDQPQAQETSESDLFAAQDRANAPVAKAQENQRPTPVAVPKAGAGGLFSRFAPQSQQKSSSEPTPQPQSGYRAHSPSAFAGGAAVAAAANVGIQGADSLPLDPHEAADAVRDLDTSAAQGLSPTDLEPTGADHGPRVLDIDDSANSGLEEFDQSYKSVPAFLRHQNN